MNLDNRVISVCIPYCAVYNVHIGENNIMTEFIVTTTDEKFDDCFDVLYGLYDTHEKQKTEEIKLQHLERCEINKQAVAKNKQSDFVEKWFHPYQPAKQSFNLDCFPSLDN